MQVNNELDVDAWLNDEPQPEFSGGSGSGNNAKSMLRNMSKTEVYELARLLAPAINEVNGEKGAVAVPMEGPRSEDFLFGDTAELEKTVAVDEEDVELHQPFGESTFTLFYMCPVSSVAFRYALFVFVVQIATYLLTLADIVDWKADDNPLKIPPMVSMTVTMAQGICFLQTLAFQSDLIEAVLKLQDGHYPEAQELHPGATFNTWLFSCVTQLTSGLCLFLGNFILTMQVDTVIELMLNFVALNFMSEIDDMGFYLAKMGFISDRLQVETEEVADFELPRKRKGGILRKILYFSMTAALFVGYSVFKSRQLQGAYLETRLYVQFGDAYNPKIPFYSGILSTQKGRNLGRRQYRDIGTQQLLLAYCGGKRAWTFSDTDDPCDFFAMSRQTDTYDVTSISNDDWMIKDEFGRFKPFETFTLLGRDCDPEICQGECVDDFCVCGNDRFGLDCEFHAVCPELVLNIETPPFTTHVQNSPYGEIAAAVSDRFEILRNEKTGANTKIYNMPVYYSQKTYPANIIFFGGRRWVLAAENSFHNITELNLDNGSDEKQWFFREKTLELLESGKFHGYDQAKFLPLFLSDPVDFETPDFLPTPAGLGWSTVAYKNISARMFEPASPVGTRFVCTQCTGDFGGYCESDGGSCNQTTGLCECNEGFLGAACEKRINCYEELWPCGGHGVCDDVSGLCRCNPPFFGELCKGVYWCIEEDGQCYNGGTCNEIGECTCSDDPMIFGYACEQRADPRVFGCENGGTLKDDLTSIECDCPPPFYGQLCSLVDTSQEIYLCSSNDDCAAETTCNTESSICDCGNTTRYGTLCEYEFDCNVNGCMNYGTCNTETGICECQGVYEGFDCSKVPDCQVDSDCHYGWCNNATGSCWCEYEISDFGKLCQINPNCGTNGGMCHNGGFCNGQGYCECPTPYTGPNCEFILSSVDHECLECAGNV